MSELIIDCAYDPTLIPAQQAFRSSRAKIRGYGGAMGGGKTRALCEEALDWALEYPGIFLPIIRQVHTAITATTRKTFFEQVLPSELRNRKDLVRVKQSQGEDLVEFLWNGSQIHFIGLDDPGKLFSSELGGAMFDEAHQIGEQDVVTVNTRIRQRCARCVRAARRDCPHMPHRMVFCFNPSSPNHWLNRWFRLGATPTEHGFRRDFVRPEGADDGASLGDMEFFLALPTQNPTLPESYIEQQLGGMPLAMKRRYLLGMWEHIDGSGYFDADALMALHEHAAQHPVVLRGRAVGDVTGQDEKDRPRLVAHSTGQLEVYVPPVKWHTTPDGDEVKAHRYVVAADASSGASADYSAVQVIDVDTLEQVAEWQGKVDTDQLADVAFILASVYNGALVAVEVTGGWGLNTMLRVHKLIGSWKGPAEIRPRVYTRRGLGKLSTRFTDLLGWDTQTASRAVALGTLEELVREGELLLHGVRTLTEMSAFAFPEKQGGVIDYRAPKARSGEHDDLVMSLAIGVYIATRQPRQARAAGTMRREETVAFGAAGY